MRKDLTGHTGPNGHLHTPIMQRKQTNKNKHDKYGNKELRFDI